MSGNPMENVPPHLQQEFMRLMEEQQGKDSALMYNNLVQRCFTQCITSFRAKTLDDKGKNTTLQYYCIAVGSFLCIRRDREEIIICLIGQNMIGFR